MTPTPHYAGRPTPPDPQWLAFLNECEARTDFIPEISYKTIRGKPVMTPEARAEKDRLAKIARREARARRQVADWEAAQERAQRAWEQAVEGARRGEGRSDL